MKKLRKCIALGLTAVMLLSMAACGDGSSAVSNKAEGSKTADNSAAGGSRTINIGTWWVQYYDSSHVLEDAVDWGTNQDAEGDSDETLESKAFNRNVCQLKFDNVAQIENRYNVKFYWKNLTYSGVEESINTSILAGSPDCDIYLVDAGMAIPAQANGLAVDLKTILPADSDLFTSQKVVSYLDMGDGKASVLMRQEAQKQVEGTYPLGFNMQMLADNNLEDPRDLYERGEWTWDKFTEYCKVLTQDSDGDGQLDQYGYCGYENETLECLMMSNGAGIASGTKETLSSSAAGEALQMMYDMYNVNNVCYPYDFEGTPSDSMRNQYTQGNIGFFPIAAWVASGNSDYDYGGAVGVTLPFDTAYVRWPVGPSGNKDTNAGKNLTAGEFYIIPAGVKDPETVYNVLYDMWNWYDSDTSIRDDKKVLNWWYGVTAKDEKLQENNFEVMKDCGSNATFDLWNSMAVEYDVMSLIKGETTPAQFQETYKQQIQDGLDAYYGN